MPNCIEIFCGLGGLSQGFCQAGYDLKLGLEIEAEQLETFSKNHPGVATICRDIRTVDAEEISKISGVQRDGLDVLLGGPPCQGFSTYGRRSNDDPRNSLYVEYAKLVDYFNPQVIVLENVVGILSMDGGAVVNEILRLFKERFGYTVTLMVLDAANYGVPQFRRRVFFVGYRSGILPKFPIPITRSPRTRGSTTDPDGEFDFGLSATAFELCSSQKLYDAQIRQKSQFLLPALTVRDALSDLPTKVFKPRETNTGIIDYATPPQNAYQSMLRAGAEKVLNHASKQHLLKRQARTLLMEQGDYGDQLHERINGFSKIAELVGRIETSDDVAQIMRRARSMDVKAEQAFLKRLSSLSQGSEYKLAQHIAAGGFANKYRRLDWDKPSHTLVAHMARDCSDFIHPDENRPISVREAARLQSFPDSFVFRSSQFRQFRGIGNSVPPLLAFALANQIRADLNW